MLLILIPWLIWAAPTTLKLSQFQVLSQLLLLLLQLLEPKELMVKKRSSKHKTLRTSLMDRPKKLIPDSHTLPHLSKLELSTTPKLCHHLDSSQLPLALRQLLDLPELRESLLLLMLKIQKIS